MKQKEELKPCPFCGGKAWVQHFPLSDTYEVRCSDCNIGTCMLLHRDIAVEMWNRRVGGRINSIR